jgi:hypothetical protein
MSLLLSISNELLEKNVVKKIELEITAEDIINMETVVDYLKLGEQEFEEKTSELKTIINIYNKIYEEYIK